MPYVEYTQRNSAEYIYNMNAVGTFTQGVLVSVLRIFTEIIVGLFIFIFLVFQDPFVLLILIILRVRVLLENPWTVGGSATHQLELEARG